MASPTSTPNSLSFSLFLNGKSPPEFAEIDRVCLSQDFFNDHFCIHKVLPIYFHFTRNNEKVPIAKLKQMFCCGADLIYRVKNAVEERKPICVPKRGKKPIRNEPALRRLVDESISANGQVSNAELSAILGKRRSTVNNIRHDLKYKYKALRHGPVLSERQVGARLVFLPGQPQPRLDNSDVHRRVQGLNVSRLSSKVVGEMGRTDLHRE